MKSYFPDINVWIALTYRGHQHHLAAATWFDHLRGDTAGFCRLTQLGFLRLLTHPTVMGPEVKSQLQAWRSYDLLFSDARVTFYTELDPLAVEDEFRMLTTSTHFSPQQWPDPYLAGFAKAGNLILVTFDGALSKLAGGKVLLLP